MEKNAQFFPFLLDGRFEGKEFVQLSLVAKRLQLEIMEAILFKLFFFEIIYELY